MLSGASSINWATVGVRVQSVALVPQNGGTPVTIYTTPDSAMLNVEQLDHIGQLLGTVTVPAGTYSAALVTFGGNPGDIALTSSSAPRADADAAPATSIAASQIAVQDVRGDHGSQTVAVQVPLATPLTAQDGASPKALDINVPLARPSLILPHAPTDNNPTLWAVMFAGAINTHAVADISSLVLREVYGTVGTVSTDGLSLVVQTDDPTEPVVAPESARPSGQSLSILVDTANGTMVYDLDSNTEVTVSNFAAAAALTAGRYLRIEARFQPSGGLVATRLWVSSQFQSVWQSPEGHVRQIDREKGTLTIENEAGHLQTVDVTDSTEFDFQGHAIGSGTAFLASGSIEPGFKVHVGALIPGKSRSAAQSIDIEAAIFSGAISDVSSSGFTYSSQFQAPTDNYTLALDYIGASSLNGTTADGEPIQGYDYWNFAYPSEIAYGPSAVADFELATQGPLSSQGISVAHWADPANPSGWALASTMLIPTPLGLATVQAGLVSNGILSSLSVLPSGASTPVTAELINASGSAPLVYQMNRGKGGVRVTPVDITTAAGLAQLTSALQVGTEVRVFGLPKSDGTVQVYTLVYYTGVNPRH